MPDGLIETELFGHGRGAFTDAKEARAGVVAQAERGTLFLDEADTLSPKAQVSLLRFLQDLRYRPVGTSAEIAADVRIIAATNQDLQRLVDEGRFRSDLRYRLSILHLWIPPLRGRPADIALLAEHFIRFYSDKYGVPPKRLHPDTLAWLKRHDWPGNVRELENWIHRELLLADGEEIRADAGLAPDAAPPAPRAPWRRSTHREGAGAGRIRERVSGERARRVARERHRGRPARRERAAHVRQVDEEVLHRSQPLQELTTAIPSRKRVAHDPVAARRRGASDPLARRARP